jgi:hypothetical protein
MTPGIWVETASTPHVVWANGKVLEPYTPFEVTKTLRFGPVDTGADLVWEQPHELEVSPGPGGVLLRVIPGSKTPSLLTIGATSNHHPLQLRALTSPHDSAGWPAELARPPGPWTDETLSVLGDQLLERGLTVGQRFISREPSADAMWIPALTGSRRIDGIPTWRRGVIEELSLPAWSTWEFARALAMQAVCAPLKRLHLIFGHHGDHSAFVKGLIAGGGFPCLEELRFSVERGLRGQIVSAPELVPGLKKTSGFEVAFPLLSVFEIDRLIPSRRPYGVVG